MSLKSKIESLLFVSNFPLTVKRLSELTEQKADAVEKAVDELEKDYKERKDSGIVLLQTDKKIQLTTAPESSKEVQKFIKDETTGELTRASLETLTIVAYRGPVTRAELEMIRGVNCSVILRNLNIRGLIENKTDKKKMDITYSITLDFMKHLGITDPKELPDFDRLNASDNLEKILNDENKKE